MFDKIKKNQEKVADAEYQATLEELVPIAHAVIDIIAEVKPPLANLQGKDGRMTEDNEKYYMEIGGRIAQLMVEKNIKFSDKEFVFNLVLVAFEQAKTKVIGSMKIVFDTAVEKVLGANLMDIRMQDINKIIKGE